MRGMIRKVNSVLYRLLILYKAWLLCIKGVEIIVYASEYIFRDIYMIARAAEDEISVYAW
jgi:hypothetical protein